MKILFLLMTALLLTNSCTRKDVEPENKKTPENLMITRVFYSQDGVKDCGIDLQLGKPEQGCEGEVCWCTITDTVKPIALVDFDLYTEPSVKSDVLRKFKKADAVKSAMPYIIKNKLGIGELLEENNEEILTSTGIKVFIIQYEGENYYSYCDGAKKLSTDRIKVLEKVELEEWLEVETNDGIKGWVKGHYTFKFLESCG